MIDQARHIIAPCKLRHQGHQFGDFVAFCGLFFGIRKIAENAHHLAIHFRIPTLRRLTKGIGRK